MLPKTKHATTNYKMLLPYVEKVDAQEIKSLHFVSDGFMDLVIEDLDYSDSFGYQMYSISHYGEMNGDLMADPDMTFSLSKEEGRVIPYSFRNDYVGVFQEVMEYANGKPVFYNKGLLHELDDFLWTWLKNTIEQGFSPEKYNAEKFF